MNVSSSELGTQVRGQVAYVGNLLGEQTRTATVRVTLANPKESWRPGLFVAVEVATAAVEVPVSVPREAIQTVEDRPSVFVRVAEGFQATPVVLGAARMASLKSAKASPPAPGRHARQFHPQVRTGQGFGRAQPLNRPQRRVTIHV